MYKFNLIISFILSIIDGIIFVNLLSVFRENRHDYRARDIITIGIISVLAFSLTLTGVIPYLKVIIISIILFLITFAYNVEFYKKILLVTLYYFIIIVSELLVTLIISNILNIDLENIELIYEYSFLFLGVISKVLTLLIASIVKGVFMNKRVILPNLLNYVFISVLLFSITSMILLFYASIGLQSKSIQFILFLISLFILFICIGVLTIYFYANDFYVALQKSTTRSIYDKTYKRFIINSKKREDSLSKIWHDMNNHIKVLEEMTAEKDGKNIEYINNLKDKIKNIPNKISSGNSLIDTILNDKYLEATSHNIDFSIKAVAPPKLNIDDLDLSSILFNSIDNSIEACLNNNLENNFIYLDLYPEGNFLYYKIKNSYNNSKKSYSKKTYLNKKEYITDGYGLRIIKDIVDKYDGYIDINKSNDEYTITIILHLNTRDFNR